MNDQENTANVLSIGEKETVYGLCEPDGRGAVDPCDDAVPAYHASLEGLMKELRQQHPGQNLTRLHLMRIMYCNEGPLGAYQARMSGLSVRSAPEIEHPLRGTVGDLRNVFDTLDLVLTMTVEAMGHRLMDDGHPMEVQNEGLTLLTTVRYLQRLTERGHRLAFARRQPDAPDAVASEASC